MGHFKFKFAAIDILYGVCITTSVSMCVIQTELNL